MIRFLRLLVVLLFAANLSCAVAAHKKSAVEPNSIANTANLTSEQDVAGKDAAFAITVPRAGQQVGTNVITVKGAGAKPGDSLRVQVMTNQWYIQDGSHEIGADGIWSYSPCHLSGQGQYRLHHSIKAELIRKGKVVATSTVDEIKAP